MPSPLRLSQVDESRVYVSVVVMKNDRVRLNLFPFIWFNYDQINLRTYVVDPKTGDVIDVRVSDGQFSGTVD